ncbi:hypothetical protein ASE63_26010 [Bosea sp. Root381]|uniref:hypothetical protein n=1 Tax=Bosea sp. Root381 TaxID=1736524 RepID=UPI000701F7AA|nr:hypothetical protein [Bosea sp. Root381]KRE03567.1 hypothetical protein ASE63_26010 [Bosea sp. Root381]
MAVAPAWIEDGEKFALIGLSVPTETALSSRVISGGLEFLTSGDFDMPGEWREWLGTIRVEQVEESKLYLLAKMRTDVPEVLDAENQKLTRQVSDWFNGLMLTMRFWQQADPFLVSGSRFQGKVDVRSFHGLKAPQRSIVDVAPTIAEEQLLTGAQIGATFAAFDGPWRSEHWRLLRCVSIYQQARRDQDFINRLHQFTRCIEGLIAAGKGKTTSQFKSRTELFVGPRHHGLMGELYEARSDFEHLHENKYLEQFDRATRIRLAELEAVAEWVARSCLFRILGKPALLAHFGSFPNLERFWSMAADEQRKAWGPCVDPYEPLHRFRFDWVSDDELGARR